MVETTKMMKNVQGEEGEELEGEGREKKRDSKGRRKVLEVKGMGGRGWGVEGERGD